MVPDFQKLWAISQKYGPLKSWGGPGDSEYGHDKYNS